MKDGNNLLEAEKESQIIEILRDERITFGAALTIIHRVEADILKDGDTFLKAEAFRNVSRAQGDQPSMSVPVPDRDRLRSGTGTDIDQEILSERRSTVSF